MEHLSLELYVNDRWQFAALPKDVSITITESSEIFGSGDVWSFPFTLNIPANAHIFGTTGEIHGSRLHDVIDKRKARLWVEGLPLYLGQLKLDDTSDVDANGNVDVILESGRKTFENMIEGGNANQVPMIGDVPIGMAKWTKRWIKYSLSLEATAKAHDSNNRGGVRGHVTEGGSDFVSFEYEGENDNSPVQEYPRMVYPRGHFQSREAGQPDWSENYVNTDHPYTEDENGRAIYPYCNIPLCYQKYDYLKTDEVGNQTYAYNEEPVAQRSYEYMPADRVNSAPCFYILYWVRALMTHLGIYIEENQMLDVEDLRRVFFVNTNCDYVKPEKLRTAEYSERFGRYSCDRAIMPEYFDPQKNIDMAESLWISTSATIKNSSYQFGLDSSLFVRLKEVKEMTSAESSDYFEHNNYYHKAFATSHCFPDANISEVIEAIESAFGVRFIFSNDFKRVRIVLLRNIFRSTEVQDIDCITEAGEVKEENNLRGFRMTYGNTDDTHFYYKGLNDMLPHIKELWIDDSDKHDYSKWKLDAVYGDIINRAALFNKTCYVTPNTGNAYGVKVDKNAKRLRDQYPSLFEYAAFMDAEDGDCTGEEETIKTVNLNFTPLIMNDLNMDAERGKDGNDPIEEQRFALFADETMGVRRLDPEDGTDYNAPDVSYDIVSMMSSVSNNNKKDEKGYVLPGHFSIFSDVKSGAESLNVKLRGMSVNNNPFWAEVNFNMEGYFYEGYHLYLQDNFEPNDDGISPIETHDWGLTMGIMRGSGSDARVNYGIDPDEDSEENNLTWDIISGTYAISHHDKCDNYGKEWRYIDETVVSKNGATATLAAEFPDSNAPFAKDAGDYIVGAATYPVRIGGKKVTVMFVTEYKTSGKTFAYASTIQSYFRNLAGNTAADVISRDTRHVIVEIGSSAERAATLRNLCELAYGNDSDTIVLDHGVDSRIGRFSLKLRAEKPNPFFDPKQAEGDGNRRYLEIDNQKLRQRGLCDQFYKEYSYFMRNARVVKKPLHMEMAQLLSIDKTKRIRTGDVMGFIRKIQYSVSQKSGLGRVTAEIMYI